MNIAITNLASKCIYTMIALTLLKFMVFECQHTGITIVESKMHAYSWVAVYKMKLER